MDDGKTDVNNNATDDGKEVTEDDLRELKYGKDGVEEQSSDETNETDEDDEELEETDDEDSEESDEDEKTDESEDDEESEFVKELPNIKGDTLEDYARNLEQTIIESNKEGKRLSDKLKELEARLDGKTEQSQEQGEPAPTDAVSLYMKQKMDEEISEAYSEFTKSYPQVKEELEYDKFTRTVGTLSRTIMQAENRLASPKELYSKAAVILGWDSAQKIDDKESLKIALKDKGAISKTSSSKPKARKKSKVTDAMIVANRMMYPDKTDEQIREELEPYIQ